VYVRKGVCDPHHLLNEVWLVSSIRRRADAAVDGALVAAAIDGLATT
jgi:hypothetical protein